MAARVWPVDAVTGAPSYTGRALRQTTVSSSSAQGSTARPLGGLSGVRPGTPTNIATATSTTWTVTPFLGLLDGEAAAIAGAYAYSFDTNQTGSVTAAAVSARIDRLDVQVDDPAESDGTSVPTIRVQYTAGVAGSGVPAAAPSRTHPLALINVPASGGGSPTVSWTATYYCAPGGFLPFNTLAGLTAWTTAGTGQWVEVQNDSTATNNGLYRWSGSAWVASSTIDARKTAARSSTPAIRATTLSAVTTSAGGDLSVTFPTAFPNAIWSVHFTDFDNGGGHGPVAYKLQSKSTTGFVVRLLSPASGAVLPSFLTTFDYTAFGE